MTKVTVYNIATGKPSRCEGVDARERCARGGWSMSPVVIPDTEPVYTPPTPEEVKAEPVPLGQPAPVAAKAKERKKPGRKPRAA